MELQLSQMDLNIKVTGKTTNKVDMEQKFGKMEANMTVIFVIFFKI